MIILFFLAIFLFCGLIAFGEWYYERDWPRDTGKFALIAGLLFLCSISAFGQNNVRWDFPVYTVQAQGGNLLPVYAIPGAGITYYSCSGSTCTTLATTYISATSGTTCPTTPTPMQVVLNGTSTCVATADPYGNSGGWFQPGQYMVTISAQGSSYNYYFTVGAGQGSGCGSTPTPIPCGGTGASTVAGAAVNLIKQFTTLPLLLADTTLTYTAGSPTTVAAGNTMAVQTSGFVYQVVASNTTITNGYPLETAGGVKFNVLLGPDGRANILAFGATGQSGARQDTAITAAIQSGLPLEFPEGTYDFSTNYTFSNNLFGTGLPSNVILRFFGSGQAILLNACGGGFTLLSEGSSQSGLQVTGLGCRYDPIFVKGFDTNSVDIGIKGGGGSYYIDAASIQAVNSGSTYSTSGQIGFRITGVSSPASNANVIIAPSVNGTFTQYAVIEGNDNTIINGSLEVLPTSGVTCVLCFVGSGNTWHNPYLEGAASIGGPYLSFSSAAGGDSVRDIYLAVNTAQESTLVSDSGFGDEYNISPDGSAQLGGAKSFLNLLSNAGLDGRLDTYGEPAGWSFTTTGSSTIARSTSTVRGGKYSLNLTATGDGHAFAAAFICTSNASANNALNPLPSCAELQGKTVTAGAWFQTSTANFGALCINNGSTTSCSGVVAGTGSWELLVVQALITSNATNISIQLRTSQTNASTTGTVYVTEPSFVYGKEIPQVNLPAPLNDGQAVMAGRFAQNPIITIASTTATPDVSEGNVFLTANASSTSITNFLNPPVGNGAQEITLIFGDANTTINNNTHILTLSGANETYVSGQMAKFIWNGTKWAELSLNALSANTAAALSGTPTLCTTGQAPTGILSNGNATGCANLGGAFAVPFIVSNAWSGHVPASQSYYLAITGVIGTTANSVFLAPVSGTLQKFSMNTVSTQPSDAGMVCAVQVNGSSSSISVSIIASATAATFSDTTHTASVTAGQAVTIYCTNSSTSNSANVGAFSLYIQ